MKRMIVFSLCASLVVMLCACAPAPTQEETTPANTETASPSTSVETTSPSASMEITPSSTSPTETPVSTPVATLTATAKATPTPAPSGPEMYSSYAHLVSFDPGTGIAQFDYFEMLYGDEAVQYLVEHRGYTLEEAQEEVDSYAESESVVKNDNPQLRAINLTKHSLSLMYQPSGEEVTDATPIPSTYSDFLAIWKLDPNLLLHTYFYYIHVNDAGNVYLVEQVFWP